MSHFPAVSSLELVSLPEFSDTRGNLLALQFEKIIPFEVARAFVVRDVPSGQVRGKHAHLRCSQFLVCIHGYLSVTVADESSRKTFLLNSPTRGLAIPPMIWAEQFDHSKDAILLVFASHPYEPLDYIDDFDRLVDLRNSRTAAIEG